MQRLYSFGDPAELEPPGSPSGREKSKCSSPEPRTGETTGPKSAASEKLKGNPQQILNYSRKEPKANPFSKSQIGVVQTLLERKPVRLNKLACVSASVIPSVAKGESSLISLPSQSVSRSHSNKNKFQKLPLMQTLLILLFQKLLQQ
eukprot:TRINITY_DN23688_c0_g1_i1.p1 TRINITY_DN23688_c0_g1~~TRINITY_DN23688_c0_g1_i1.p1  ORF type:complete len:147 (+),score=1.41 TRINITY_DN23688_c0_g1_i1:54-494(+)